MVGHPVESARLLTYGGGLRETADGYAGLNNLGMGPGPI
jgi:hypothetical protein